jgi:hypothetical protein
MVRSWRQTSGTIEILPRPAFCSSRPPSGFFSFRDGALCLPRHRSFMRVLRRRDQTKETVMRSRIIPSAAAIIAVLGTVPAAALTLADNSVTKAAASQVIPADYSHRRHNAQTRPSRYQYQRRVPPQLRGYQDPGYAYHGNINGCVIDQGYGRWAPCDSGR